MNGSSDKCVAQYVCTDESVLIGSLRRSRGSKKHIKNYRIQNKAKEEILNTIKFVLGKKHKYL